MAINVNTGPERVEVNLVSTGVLQIAGASTSRTAFIIYSTFSSAPKDTATLVTSLDEYETSFGDEDDSEQGWYAVRGFFANAGSGAQAVIVCIEPTGAGSTVHEAAENQAPRVITAGAGYIEDDGDIEISLDLSAATSTWSDTSNQLTATTGSFTRVRAGDRLVDDDGKMFYISAVDATNKILTLTTLYGDLLSNTMVSGSDAAFKANLTFETADAVDTETFTMGSYTFEYDSNSTYTAGNIPIVVGVSVASTIAATVVAINANVPYAHAVADGKVGEERVAIFFEDLVVLSDAAAAGKGDWEGSPALPVKAKQYTTDCCPNMASSAAKIVRLFTADAYNNSGFSQEDTASALISPTVTAKAVSGTTATLTCGSGLLNAGVSAGDIFVDASSNEFYITAVTDDNEFQVYVFDSAIEPATGAGTIYDADLFTITDMFTKQSGTTLWDPGANNFESASAGSAVFDSAVSPEPAGSLAGSFMVQGANYEEVSYNDIIQDTDVAAIVQASGAATLTYDTASGVCTLSAAETMAGAAAASIGPGNVLVDSAGTAHVINCVYQDNASDVLAFAIGKGRSVGLAAAWAIYLGKNRVYFEDTTFTASLLINPDFLYPLNRIETSNTGAQTADDYFIHSLTAQNSDYIGTSANGKGLYALDDEDDLGLVCVPGDMHYSIHSALIDYCEAREDCFSLLSVPAGAGRIQRPISDSTILTATVSAIVNGTSASTVTFSGSPTLSAVTTSHLFLFSSVYYRILDVDATDNKITVDSTSVTGTGSSSVVNPSAITYKDTTVNNPSIYAAWFFPWVQMLKISDSSTVEVDPVGHLAGMMARIDNNASIGGVSHAPAGSYAYLSDTLGYTVAISESNHGEDLREAFINRLQSFTDLGRICYGGYTAGGSSVTAEEQLIQVMRTMVFIKKSLESGLRRFIWENYSSSTQLLIKGAIENFLRINSYLFPAGTPESQKFQVELPTPTAAELAAGLLKVKVQVSTNVSVRFIDISLEFPIPTVTT